MRMYCPATDPAHKVKVPFKPSHDDLICKEHPGTPLKMASQLKPRKPLNRVSEKRAASGKPSLKRGRGFSASPEQQKKVKGLPCIVCGRDEYEGVQIQAAHVYPRRLQACDCAEGVVPICGGCHALYDDQNARFDLQPFLVNRKYHAELVHAAGVHEVPLTELLFQVTGCKYVAEPSTQKEAAMAAGMEQS